MKHTKATYLRLFFLLYRLLCDEKEVTLYAKTRLFVCENEARKLMDSGTYGF